MAAKSHERRFRKGAEAPSRKTNGQRIDEKREILRQERQRAREDRLEIAATLVGEFENTSDELDYGPDVRLVGGAALYEPAYDDDHEEVDWFDWNEGRTLSELLG